MQTETKINCPKCGETIDVNTILSSQIEDNYKKKFQLELEQEKKMFNNKLQSLVDKEKELNDKMAEQNKVIAESVGIQLKAELEKKELELKRKLQEEQSDKIALIEKELSEKSIQLKELNKTKAEIEQLKRLNLEQKEAIEAEAQKMLNLKIAEEKEKIKKVEQEKNELVIMELQKKLEDQKKLTIEMQRKQEQGSMQLQGEVQELAIEDYLRNNFTLDTIQEIKKGERGADCLQIINTRTQSNCGTIYYESKRTKNFKNDWIDKLKEDLREKGASIGVLVTEVYPKGIEKMYLDGNIWVCSYSEFKGLCLVLRQSIIDISNVLASQENKGDKMVMLYNFLTGNQFKAQVEAIVSGFSQMQADLIREKRATNSAWKKREEQLKIVLENTAAMYGSVRGISGNAVQEINLLEFESDTPLLD
jgi:hypothetical protein